LAIWVPLLGLGALVLRGRFSELGPPQSFPRQAYFSSLYFFVLVVPVAYALIRAAGGSQRVAAIVTALIFVVASLPARWLGLERWRRVPWGHRDWTTPTLQWLPEHLGPGAPLERPLLVALLIVFVAARVALSASPRPWRRIAVEAGLFSFILAQAALHTSMRSPYTYVPHFENGAWYHDNILPGPYGAVNADRYQFLWLDDHFNGVPEGVHAQLLRRPFIHYIGSWFSFFCNDYYVYLALNSVLWLAAALCMRDWVYRVTGARDLARWATVLTACGSGFIYYVAQPMSYLGAYVAVIFAWWACELTLIAAAQERARAALLFGVVLGLCSTTYDFFSVYPALLLYVWLRRGSLVAAVAALIIGAGVYRGYLAVQHDLLGLSLYSDNALHAQLAMDETMKLLHHPIDGSLWLKSLRALIAYAQDLLYAFYGLTALVALAGLFVDDRRTRAVVLILMLPTLIGTTVLYYGGEQWGRVLIAQLPRLTFGAYPAIYLAAAVALAWLEAAVARTRLGKIAWVAPWLLVASIVAIANVDVFGHPEAAYHFYWPTPMSCPPYELYRPCPAY
jgi:hypothetical protein